MLAHRRSVAWGVAVLAWVAASGCYDGLQCQSDDDCFAGEYCSDRSCVPVEAAGSSCESGSQCRSTVCHDHVCGHRVFVTDELYDGNLGGLEGAHRRCRQAAEDAELKGTWKAILSDSERDARDVIAVDGDVVNMKDRLVVRAENIWKDKLQRPVNFSETGAKIGRDSTSDDSVWTGTTRDGIGRGHFCEDWTSASDDASGDVGDAGDGNYQWIAEDTGRGRGRSPVYCSKRVHLYCIDGQG